MGRNERGRNPHGPPFGTRSPSSENPEIFRRRARYCSRKRGRTIRGTLQFKRGKTLRRKAGDYQGLVARHAPCGRRGTRGRRTLRRKSSRGAERSIDGDVGGSGQADEDQVLYPFPPTPSPGPRIPVGPKRTEGVLEAKMGEGCDLVAHRRRDGVPGRGDPADRDPDRRVHLRRIEALEQSPRAGRVQGAPIRSATQLSGPPAAKPSAPKGRPCPCRRP